MAYPYTPAFVAFCCGAPAEEIAAEFGIPLESLKAKMRQEGWRGLANRMAGRVTADFTPQHEALAKCEANRAKNFEVAAELRDHLVEVVKALRAGTLRIKKVLHYRGQTLEYEAVPGPADWVSIANYAMTVANLTYRALGDHAANGTYRADAGPETPAPAPPITIVLPGAVAMPREERCLEVDAKLLDQAGRGEVPPALLPPA